MDEVDDEDDVESTVTGETVSFLIPVSSFSCRVAVECTESDGDALSSSCVRFLAGLYGVFVFSSRFGTASDSCMIDSMWFECCCCW